MNSFIIKDIRLFDGDKVVENSSVRVENGIITEVGDNASKDGTPVISKPGHTLVPGLIEAHCHPYDNVKLPEQCFRFGITTLMDMHNVHEHAVQQKQWARERTDFPDIKSCHYAATISGGWPAFVEKKLSKDGHEKFDKYPNIATEADAEAYIARSLQDGADYIKLMHEVGTAIGIPPGLIAQPTESVQAAVVRAAHQKGLKVIAHALSRKDTLEVLRAGVDGLAHTFFDEPITPQVIELYRRNRAWCTPTLGCSGSMTGESLNIVKQFSEDPRVRSRVLDTDVQVMQHCMHLKADTARWDYAIDSVRQLRAAGVQIVTGSDSAPGAPGLVFGVNLHIEMFLLVHKAGMTPLEVLKSTTSVTADAFGWSDRGRIGPGLKADLVLVEGNPMVDITDMLNIRGIWRDGVKFEGHEGFPLS
ncbi:uncharacterized protein Z520_09561 [Fonsecaea multimorphosa CBS 102226]|uniref:Amidohydrolase-related domain-containing protein n=1 Tax=Fonsecaea multimorphosa CBS 102226 TaxID=1442371 RepID=A0A0D2ICK1_9EURO|nr:uncharacterized protein Z520_09561 [Fonsecaea multimorphosa CBS 102226]KIX94871.1 hypothetical protein Z520_09561 [Fonsecaea multimorphosa CBS 102226]OAL20448.1 hypothetical protein AYO22_08942 [Fonsecaea multimorphosa]